LPIDFTLATRPLIGSRVSHAWKGYGSAIFLELGNLAPPKSERFSHPSGEWCIAIEWDWRVELGTGILFGSSNSGAVIAERIPELEASTIQSIRTVRDVPELLVSLSTGHRIRTSAMVTGDPQWSIKLAENAWLCVVDGDLQMGDGREECTPEESQAWDYETLTAKRWGTPTVEPAIGSCFQCSSFVRLDGHAYLLDYGVCTASDSRLDGKVVNRASGCPQFTAEKGA
jgi:hypothetical protein